MFFVHNRLFLFKYLNEMKNQMIGIYGKTNSRKSYWKSSKIFYTQIVVEIKFFKHII